MPENEKLPVYYFAWAKNLSKEIGDSSLNRVQKTIAFMQVEAYKIAHTTASVDLALAARGFIRTTHALFGTSLIGSDEQFFLGSLQNRRSILPSLTINVKN